MRRFGVFRMVVLAAVSSVAAAHGEDERSSSGRPPETFTIETFVGRMYNYLNDMVDKENSLCESVDC
ncbi:MAG: hypothetical protein WCB27_05495 [Thermoguttaceae bacterium]